MDLITVLIIGAFVLGSCPFSVWIGRFALHTDIRKYGDGNPGCTNVFRAGSKKWGTVALILDLTKGMPFIILAKYVFTFQQPYLYIIAFAAILGHAYTPFLGFHGGKAVATFGGSLLAMQQWDIVVSMILLLIFGFLFVGNDSWTVIIATAGTVFWLVLSHQNYWGIVFMAGMTLFILVKNFHDFSLSGPSGRLVSWVRSKR